MSFKLILVAIFISGCGVKSKPIVPRDPNIDKYIQEKLQAPTQSIEEDDEDKKKKDK